MLTTNLQKSMRGEADFLTQNLTRKYHHTASESLYLYRLCGAKISWTPTLVGMSY